MTRGPLHSAGTLVAMLLCATFAVRPAQADDKQTCLASYEQSQRLRNAGKLRASREQLLVCVREVCPSELSKDCHEWLTQVAQSMPSVVFVARGSDGQRLTNVRVAVDGSVVTERLDGKPLDIDPGQHAVRYEIEGLAPVDTSLTVSGGEKNRVVELPFPRGPGDGSRGLSRGETSPAPARPPDAAASTRPVPPLAVVLAGAGAVGLGVFAYFGISGLTIRSELDACKGSCAQDRVDEGERDLLIADTALAVGVAALGVATILFVTRPSVPKRTATTWATLAW